jgi:hypothetical protein
VVRVDLGEARVTSRAARNTRGVEDVVEVTSAAVGVGDLLSFQIVDGEARGRLDPAKHAGIDERPMPGERGGYAIPVRVDEHASRIEKDGVDHA